MGGESRQRHSVVLADDHFVFRAGVRAVLASEPAYEVVAESADVPGTVRAVEEYAPDLLIFDVGMPGGPVLAALPEMLEASPTTRAVALTMHDSPAFVRHALEAGAVGYVLKEAVGTELLGALALVLSGGTYVHPTLGAALAGVHADDRPALSAREREVLGLIAQGYTNAQVAQALHLGQRTVEAHRARLREKLGAVDRAQLVAHAHAYGLLGDDAPSPQEP